MCGGRSRLTLAAYRSINFTDLIARDFEEYTRLGVWLVNNDTVREGLQERLRAAARGLFLDSGALEGWEEVFEASVLKRSRALCGSPSGSGGDVNASLSLKSQPSGYTFPGNAGAMAS